MSEFVVEVRAAVADEVVVEADGVALVAILGAQLVEAIASNPTINN
ncbi:hypothetical protein H6F95_15520 [Cyanobacteria bacterium FACHB-471]|nr:hypothetical protein [Cyanobacteria bacterium FACHB-471]